MHVARRFRGIVAVGLFVLTIASTATAKYSGGTGEPNDPYQIATAADLIALGETPDDYDKHFKLTGDIDLAAYSGTAFSMIGTYSVPFTGVFDGSGHTISNFRLSRSSEPVGMFGYVNGSNASIKDLTLMNPVIKASCYRVGSIIGYLKTGTLSKCYAKGGSISASGNLRIGGLVGESWGTVADCNAGSDVSGQDNVGGVAGENHGSISRCCFTGKVAASDSSAGGIVGNNFGTVSECWVTGVVSSRSCCGGLVGINRPNKVIRNCYSQGAVSGQERLGGLVGLNEGTIKTCYSASSVTGTAKTGGLVGIDDDGHVYSSFWDMQSSGQTTSGGGWGKTTPEMQTASTFVLWGREAVWTIDDGKDYPHLAWQNMPGQIITTLYGGGDGTERDPYLVATAEQFCAISNDANDWDKHFTLMEDLDLTGISVYPISYWSQTDKDKPFSGVFDGNGKAIKNFKSPVISSGLFDYVSGPHAEIRNVTLVDPNIEGVFVGPLVGCLEEGIIKDCAVVSGNIRADSYVGGLIGFVTYGVVKNCYSNANVTGNWNIGGLVGMCMDDAMVVGCRANGVVQGAKYVGGLVGLCRDSAMIMNCESSGAVSGTEYAVGGLVGQCLNGPVIAGSSATGDVSGQSQIGGLVGNLEYSRVACCYATGSTSGPYPGGFVGKADGSYIADSYSVGQVVRTGGSGGGFSATNDVTPEYDCFWNVDTSGQTSSSGTGAKGLNTSKMQDPNTFIDAGWDLVGETDNGPSDIWIMPDGGGYPILSWQASPLPPLPRFSGGTGEPNDPYIISTPQELNSIGHNPRLMGGHFKLANDVNLAGTKFFPIGHQDYPFGGAFDGDGYTISSLVYAGNMRDGKYIGLFGHVCGVEAEIKNVRLTNSSVIGEVNTSTSRSSNPEKIGSLVGLLYDGTVLNCHVDADSEVLAQETVRDDAGGLIGQNGYGRIEGCSSAATVDGEGDVGGLVGSNYRGIILDCQSSGNVLGGYECGGLVGYNTGYINGCSASGNVAGTAAGGLVGTNGEKPLWEWNRIYGCISTGNVSGRFTAGGLVAFNYRLVIASCAYGDVTGDGSNGDQGVGGLVGYNSGDILYTYARGSVSGNQRVGGLVGNNTYTLGITGSVVTSYSTGTVSGPKDVGGLVHRGDETATTSGDCFWDTQTSKQTTSSGGGTGKTTAEMQTAKTFLDAGWDFVGETTNGTEDIWWILEGKDYPRLWWELIPEK